MLRVGAGFCYQVFLSIPSPPSLHVLAPLPVVDTFLCYWYLVAQSGGQGSFSVVLVQPQTWANVFLCLGDGSLSVMHFLPPVAGDLDVWSLDGFLPLCGGRLFPFPFPKLQWVFSCILEATKFAAPPLVA